MSRVTPKATVAGEQAGAAARSESQSVRSVERALEILLLFSLEQQELSITEIARHVELPKSTVHRLLTALQNKGFIQQNPENQKYALGMVLLHLGHLVAEQLDIRRVAKPLMRRLERGTGETVNLNVVRDGCRVCVEKVESHQDVRHFVEIGRRLPLYCGSAGKVLMAYMDPDEVEEIVERTALRPYASHTITDPEALRQELTAIRRRGYATSSNERVEGASSVSAPVRDSTGRVVASLTISGPSFRFTPEKVLSFVDQVVQAARELSVALGYRGE